MKDNKANQQAYQRAKKRIEAKFGFKIHLLVYIIVCTVLIMVNLNGSTEYFWAKWPVLGWGIALLFHWLAVFVFANRPAITEEMIKKEMEKEIHRN